MGVVLLECNVPRMHHNNINLRMKDLLILFGCYLSFYVTDGNIMYLTDASRFLISCVIQHYAPVVGWGNGGTDA